MAVTKKKPEGKSAEATIIGKVVFKFKKETPGAVQYAEVDGSGNAKTSAESLIGSLYLRKDKLNGTIPQVLKVTVEA